MTHKEFVTVFLIVDSEGKRVPLKMKLPNGEVCAIDRVLGKGRSTSPETGEKLYDYSVSVRGKQTHLYENHGRWYIETDTSCDFRRKSFLPELIRPVAAMTAV